MFQHRGFTVLAFPTNDFHQELESNKEIQEFLQDAFPQVSFPVFGMSSLKENPVYQMLRKQLPGEHVQHNFFKYLVNERGVATQLFSKKRSPMSLAGEIQKLLDERDDGQQKPLEQ